MQVGETNLMSKDVQRLLWAAGEARAHARRPEPTRPAGRRHLKDQPVHTSDAGFFTEWQAATG